MAELNLELKANTRQQGYSKIDLGFAVVRAIATKARAKPRRRVVQPSPRESEESRIPLPRRQ